MEYFTGKEFPRVGLVADGEGCRYARVSSGVGDLKLVFVSYIYIISNQP